MIATLAFLSITLQKLGPVLPPQCSPTFQTAVIAVEEAMQSGDFKTAESRLRLLPRKSISFIWDDSKVPAKFKAEFLKARDGAFALWHKQIPDIKFEPSPNGDQIQF